MPFKSPCASLLMPYLDEVSGIFSSIGKNPRSEGSDTEQSTVSENI